MEIGSIFEIKPPVINKQAENSSLISIKKYNKKYCVYTASGREAIALALKSIKANRPELGGRCLLPAYMCDTVYFPFEREGYELYFYHIDKEFKVDTDELFVLIDKIGPAVLLIHPYYGVDTCRNLRPFLKEIKNKGLCIIEDATQSLYLKEAENEADYVIGSLRKWYPVPDGGFVVSDEKPAAKFVSDNGDYAKRRLEPLTDKWRYLFGEDSDKSADIRAQIKSGFLKRNRELEKQLDEFGGIRRMSDETAYILERLSEDEAREKRADNCAFLYERIKGLNGSIKAALNYDKNAVEEAAAPLYLPVYAHRRDELQAFLTKRDIYAPVLWPIGKENVNFLTNDEKYIFEHILALPIDQRYGREEMRRIAETLKEYTSQDGITQNIGTGAAKEYDQADTNAYDVKDRADRLIGIRADANDEAATGHIMRCITVAKQLNKLGYRVCFFTADEFAKEMLDRAGMEQVCLHTEWNDMEAELPALRAALTEKGCKKLLVDSYCVSVRYFEELSDLCKLIYIDDCFEGIYPVDMIINYNAFHTRFNYKEAYEKAYGGRTKFLLGTAYVPLREEFDRRCGGLREENNSSKKNVLISSGGGDTYNAIGGVLESVLKDSGFDNVIFHAVVGSFNRNEAELERLSKEYKNICLHRNVTDMAKLMAGCDAAVSAAGTMLFELSALQVPTVFFVSADNQKYDSEFFAKGERMSFAGDIRLKRDECLKNVCIELQQILQDEELRLRMKKALHEVTDAKGARRIAEAIVKL